MMTEVEWDACTDPIAMLNFVRGTASDRKLRLFAVAVCRRVRPQLSEASRPAAEVSERFADGLASSEELEGARETFRDWNSSATYRCDAAWATTSVDAWQ